MNRSLLIAGALALAVAACNEQQTAAIPSPASMTEEAVGHLCQMYVLDHPGPKAQAFLDGHEAPIWFSQVRDALGYMKAPEKTAEIVVVYVSDMGAAPSWEDPGADNWIRADTAVFVVGTSREGGMGAPEVVPFAEQSAAEDFARRHGGTTMRLADIPVDAVLGAIDIEPPGAE